MCSNAYSHEVVDGGSARDRGQTFASGKVCRLFELEKLLESCIRVAACQGFSMSCDSFVAK